ncbi:hypothetical protein GALMADRAFT_270144 [Galerina marginata CBS 339.88]|uniref:Uncharacterized protein n=1 Tax=Galerina marginata (strain CBS 339.88) TaxID=685588 RepID=A0A067T2R1_GALM3|nr:hypothetical protein GALMADRAFT_270144 [Galerina marginata CBS 339.88]
MDSVTQLLPGNGSAQPQNEAEPDPVIESVEPSKTLGETTKPLVPTNSQPQNSPRPSSQPNSAPERSAPETKTGYDGLSTIPRKRKADDSGSITLSDENRLPPKRRRKQDSCLSQPQAIPTNNGDQQPVDSKFCFLQLGSLLQQCKEVSERGSAHCEQEELRRRNMELTHRAEISRMQKQLDKTQSAWVRETNALNKVKGELEKVKEKLRQEEQVSSDLRRQAEFSELLDLAREGEEEEERKVQATAFDKIQQELATAKSALSVVEEQRRVEVEASGKAQQELVVVKASLHALEKKRKLKGIAAKRKISGIETQLANAENRASSTLEEISKLETRAVDAENRLNARLDAKVKRKRMNDEEQFLKKIGERLSTIEAGLESILLALQQLRSGMEHEKLQHEHKLKRAQRKIVRFHFSTNILSSYFLVMLKDQKIWRASAEEKEDDVHDLWDVQEALQRALDGYSSYMETIPNRSDYYGDVGCPLCEPAESSTADSSIETDLLTSRKAKNPPVKIGPPTHRRIKEGLRR